MMKIKWILSLAYMMILNIQGQTQSYKGLKDISNLDSRIIYGQLPNGFTYYIKPLAQKTGKVSMDLIVKAGSRYQMENQGQIAHFLEHLPFARTKHYAKIARDVQLLSELQMQAGDIGGATGANETVYTFNHPSGNLAAFKTGLLFFRDIASGNILFNKEDIDSEKEIFFQEYLYGNGPSLYSTIKAASLLSDCMNKVQTPVNHQNYIRNLDIYNIQRFYKDWYKPNRMALIVVGDIENQEEMMQMIKTIFGDIKNTPTPKLPIDCKENYLARKNQFVLLNDAVKDSEIEKTPIVFRFFMRDNNSNQFEETYTFNSNHTKEMGLGMLNKRFRKAMSSSYNIPYKIYAAQDLWLPAIRIEVKVDKSHGKEGVQKAFSIIKEINRNGFTLDEFEAYKQETINELSQIDTLSPQYWNKQIRAHFIEDKMIQKPIMSIEFLERLSLNEFNSFIKKHFQEMPEDIAIITPGEKDLKINETEIRQWIKESKKIKNDEFKPSLSKKLLSLEQIDKLKPVNFTDHGMDEFGAHKITLENGLKLVLKPFIPSQDRHQNDILIHGFNSKGAFNVQKEDFYSAILIPDIVQHSGVGNYNKFQLHESLHDTKLSYSVRPYISSQDSGIKGEVSFHSFEEALQLIYLYMVEPRWDMQAFNDWKRQEEIHYMRFHGIDRVQKDFINTVQENRGNNIPMRMSTKRYQSVKAVDYKKAYQIYKSLMQDSENLTFVITGNYSLETTLPLLRKYLGNLPSKSQNIFLETDKEHLPISLPKTPLKKIYHPDLPIQNVHVFQTYLRQSIDTISLKEQIEYDLLTGILSFRLNELRFKKERAVYISVAANGVDLSNKLQFINLILSCSIEDFPKVENDLIEMVNNLKVNGVNEEMFELVMRSNRNYYYSNIARNKNKRMLQSLYNHYQYGTPYYKQDQVDNIIKSIKREHIPIIAQKYLDDKLLMNFAAKSDIN
ncbi:M16 family metallopeptidase [Gelidibacter sp. F63206]|uniref:M16 family metallopeptidase n=1 Tax=Gelidibacter sp. F63206 TaxID=2926425 RepID=UPI001FF1FF26|nr:insulinase family protein [Gelidibacter sp. F63206]MCK0115252.1 insulinase family protein [Gelidibacter sp. F63206]